ncbi:hypothetical protein IMZ29_00975 [Achromobacter sp. GG226]|nr:hypothetical protein [Verticiella sp. GG226]
MPDGSTWGIPVEVIARHRASHYAHEFDGDVEKSLAEDTGPLFASDEYEVHDWAANNMNWSDVAADHAVRIDGAKPVDYQEGWTNGEYEVCSLPSVLKDWRC